MDNEEITLKHVMELISSPEQFNKIHEEYCEINGFATIDSEEFINYLFNYEKERHKFDSYKLKEQLHLDLLLKDVIYEISYNDSTSGDIFTDINNAYDDVISSENDLITKKRNLSGMLDKCSNLKKRKGNRLKKAIKETN